MRLNLLFRGCVLIVPYGIEIAIDQSSGLVLDSFNRTLWN